MNWNVHRSGFIDIIEVVEKLDIWIEIEYIVIVDFEWDDDMLPPSESVQSRFGSIIVGVLADVFKILLVEFAQG
ncbi:hypothetical protein BRC64_12575 [Halobacteriales archaeon QH_10_67_22]|nr:MAG: hypothetical protein BRC64_12575 [Halobacteriales archaeon QH_10_67_22]